MVNVGCIPIWLANIVRTKKKNGVIQVFIDFRDLNKACLKDDFPVPHIELLIGATTGLGTDIQDITRLNASG